MLRFLCFEDISSMTWKAEDNDKKIFLISRRHLFIYCLLSLVNSLFCVMRLFQCGLKTIFDPETPWCERVPDFVSRLVFINLEWTELSPRELWKKYASIICNFMNLYSTGYFTSIWRMKDWSYETLSNWCKVTCLEPLTILEAHWNHKGGLTNSKMERLHPRLITSES